MLRVAGPFEGVRAGQFCMLRSAEHWPVLLPRPFSWFDVFEPGDAALHSDEATGAATFLGKVVGPGTARLAALEVGDELHVTGPLGRAWPSVEKGGPEPICIAGGVGLAPFLLWAKERRAAGTTVSLLYGGASAQALAAAGDFAATGADFHFATLDGSRGHRGSVLDLYRDLVGRGLLDGAAPVYCCGPDPMMEAVAAECRGRGVRCVVSLETYMACGYGVCNGCTVEVRSAGRFAGRRYVKSCIEGPVFDSDELLWHANTAHG